MVNNPKKSKFFAPLSGLFALLISGGAFWLFYEIGKNQGENLIRQKDDRITMLESEIRLLRSPETQNLSSLLEKLESVSSRLDEQLIIEERLTELSNDLDELQTENARIESNLASTQANLQDKIEIINSYCLGTECESFNLSTQGRTVYAGSFQIPVGLTFVNPNQFEADSVQANIDGQNYSLGRGGQVEVRRGEILCVFTVESISARNRGEGSSIFGIKCN